MVRTMKRSTCLDKICWWTYSSLPVSLYRVTSEILGGFSALMFKRASFYLNHHITDECSHGQYEACRLKIYCSKLFFMVIFDQDFMISRKKKLQLSILVQMYKHISTFITLVHLYCPILPLLPPLFTPLFHHY